MLPSSFTRETKQFLLLGKLLVKRHPELATELMQEVTEDEPQETDLSKIESYFQSFCEQMNIDPHEYKGGVKKRSKTHIRRLFVSVMIHIYQPQSFRQPTNQIIITYGFNRTISQVLGLNEAYMCRVVRDAIGVEKIYQDYREQVDEIRRTLTTQIQDHEVA